MKKKINTRNASGQRPPKKTLDQFAIKGKFPISTVDLLKTQTTLSDNVTRNQFTVADEEDTEYNSNQHLILKHK